MRNDAKIRVRVASRAAMALDLRVVRNILAHEYLGFDMEQAWGMSGKDVRWMGMQLLRIST
jgi:hypothetical protein